MSTPAQRLLVIHEAFSKAYARRAGDLKDARSDAEADRILRNVDSLETAYLKAAKQALDASGEAVEEAYNIAKKAQKDINDAYNKAKALPERISLSTSVVRSVSELIRKASGH